MSEWMLCSYREYRMRNYDLDMVKEIATMIVFGCSMIFFFIALLVAFGTM